MSEPTERLREALDAAREVAAAANSGAPPDQLDELAGLAVQKFAAFRGSLRRVIIHWRTTLDELDYDGAACLAAGGYVTNDPGRVTCAKCAADLNRPTGR